MIIAEARHDEALILQPDGRLDQDSAADFQERLVQAVSGPDKAVIVDFSMIPYISSVGLRAIMIAAKQSKVEGVSLSVAALTPTVNEIFEISRFSYVVNIFENLKEAIGAVSDTALQAYEAS